MPHTISDLISSRNLCEADVKETLKAAGLPTDSETYSDEDIHNKFDLIRAFFDRGEVSSYEEAKELLETQNLAQDIKAHKTKTKETGKGRRNRKGATVVPISSVGASEGQTNQAGGPIEATEQKDNSNNSTNSTKSETDILEGRLSVSDLVNRVNEQLGLTLTLKQVFAVFEASGLPDKEYYNSTEAKRFLRACAVLMQDSSETKGIGSSIHDTVAASEKGLIGLLDEVTYQRAKQVPALVNQLYMQNVTLALAENQEEIETFYMQLKDSIIAGIEGKSPLAEIMQVDWTVKRSPELPSLPRQSLETLEDTMTVDLSSESVQNS